jgi:hypothetical protein
MLSVTYTGVAQHVTEGRAELLGCARRRRSGRRLPAYVPRGQAVAAATYSAASVLETPTPPPLHPKEPAWASEDGYFRPSSRPRSRAIRSWRFLASASCALTSSRRRTIRSFVAGCALRLATVTPFLSEGTRVYAYVGGAGAPGKQAGGGWTWLV